MAVIGLVSAGAVKAEIRVQDVKLKKDVWGLQSKVNQIAAQYYSLDAAAAVRTFAEELCCSHCEALADAEADLSAAVDELQAPS